MSKLTTGTIARERREELGLTRLELAYLAQVSVSTIDRLELQDKVPGVQSVLRIAKQLDMSLDTLLALETPAASDSKQTSIHQSDYSHDTAAHAKTEAS